MQTKRRAQFNVASHSARSLPSSCRELPNLVPKEGSKCKSGDSYAPFCETGSSDESKRGSLEPKKNQFSPGICESSQAKEITRVPKKVCISASP
jgi:hypothetical protein